MALSGKFIINLLINRLLMVHALWLKAHGSWPNRPWGPGALRPALDLGPAARLRLSLRLRLRFTMEVAIRP